MAPGVLKRLKDLLADKGQPYPVRANAYPSLLSVAGLPAERWPKRVAGLANLDAEVDWALVENLASTS